MSCVDWQLIIHSWDFIHSLGSGSGRQRMLSYTRTKFGGMFDGVSDTALVASIGDSACAENIACARRLAAIAELYDRRQYWIEDGHGRERWRVDPWEAVAAEVAAAQGITACAASALMHNAICLHERLPKVAALFATGAICYRTVALIVARTLLALDPEALATIDAELAEALTRWGVLSRNKTEQHIDALVERHDPDARRRTRRSLAAVTSASSTVVTASPGSPVISTPPMPRCWSGG